MAALLVCLLLSTVSTAIAQIPKTNITLGSSLSTTANHSQWLSPSGHFAFGFYPMNGGFMVGIWIVGSSNNTVVWTANRNSAPLSSGASLVLSNTGRLLLITDGQRQESLTNASESASYASMFDSGNFILYNSRSQAIWESFRFPTDTVLATQTIWSPTVLFSHRSDSNHSIGRFRIVLQSDGNLVSYPAVTIIRGKDAYWASATDNQGANVSLHLEDDGRLYLVGSTGIAVKNLTESQPGTSIYRATVDVDGVFRLYSHIIESNGSVSDGTVSWATINNGERCKVKGICGPNSFCTIEANGPSCNCPQGFDYVDPDQKFLGCKPKLPTETCGEVQKVISYEISTLANTKWENDDYAFIPVMRQEECKQACLVDCDCMAALFKNGNCAKKKLPLIYGVRDVTDQTVAFVKAGSGNLTSNPILIKKKTIGKGVLVVGIVLISFSFIILIISGCVVYKSPNLWYRRIPAGSPLPDLVGEVNLRSFAYEELVQATDSFKEELGRGAFGKVYKGNLPNGVKRSIAVKKLEILAEEGEREFAAEMKTIAMTHHRNLARLIGFCNDGSNRLLIYEYMSNGSLADFLFKAETRPVWNERVRIAVDIARGIHYLHEECGVHIIHCDIKPQNILMDECWNARISDFGLAKLLMPDQTKTYTGIRGTRGYVAPEWHKNAPITTKADVYSYGIVLLEIVCCRRHLDIVAAEEEVILLDWACNCFEEGKLGKLVGNEDVETTVLERTVKVAMWCVQDEPMIRPTMKKVILMLEGTIPIPHPPSISSFKSIENGSMRIQAPTDVQPD